MPFFYTDAYKKILYLFFFICPYILNATTVPEDDGLVITVTDENGDPMVAVAIYNTERGFARFVVADRGKRIATVRAVLATIPVIAPRIDPAIVTGRRPLHRSPPADIRPFRQCRSLPQRHCARPGLGKTGR